MSSHIIHFGDRNSHLELLQRQYPKLQFKRIQQVHGNHVVSTSPHSIDFSQEADAHFTSNMNVGLCIATADCMPIFIYAPNISTVFAIHAGWKGVENRIVPKSLKVLKSKSAEMSQLMVFIGPHIQFDSFEVENPVRDRLLQSCSAPSTDLWRQISDHKSLVNLSQIVTQQLQEFAISPEHIVCSKIDTKTNSDYHSYRRDKENSGRQISFIALVD